MIRNRMHRGLVLAEKAELMFKAVQPLGVRFLYPDGLHQKAWELAKRFSRPQAYDSYYLALAEILNLELWTADERLYNAVQDELPWVRWLGHYRPV